MSHLIVLCMKKTLSLTEGFSCLGMVKIGTEETIDGK